MTKRTAWHGMAWMAPHPHRVTTIQVQKHNDETTKSLTTIALISHITKTA